MPRANCGFYWDEQSHWYMRLWDKRNRLVSVCDQLACTPETFTPSENILEQVSQTLLAQLPDVAEKLSVARSWHCFRSYSNDKLPVFGEDSEHSGFFWLAGFGGYGMSTSFAATEDAANVLNGTCRKSFEDFSPQRAKIQALRSKVSAIS
jgi:D-arginine dehydrogenase